MAVPVQPTQVALNCPRWPLEKTTSEVGCQYIIPEILFAKKQKLHWISNLLLQNKVVRASAPNIIEKSGETAWACLRHAHETIGISDESRVMECLYDSARTYFIKNSWRFLIARAERVVTLTKIVRSDLTKVFNYFLILPARRSGVAGGQVLIKSTSVLLGGGAIL